MTYHDLGVEQLGEILSDRMGKPLTVEQLCDVCEACKMSFIDSYDDITPVHNVEYALYRAMENFKDNPSSSHWNQLVGTMAAYQACLN